ncbi:helix-turn-helix domain-containing protein [Streptomyces sp. HB2AG]|uniref:helix-turn-helix domain-containing protein n=1 Tax=Streptomyces sp. HB2AG TaxID=2983400 RepID=UPI0022AAE8B3|nr:helix-turn-helix transcriptional regulator [Streptomyces sp. HB2AG]MCZ2523136.1 helix-turn-helix transcriptional regulator [Streptomyces sp. HB2AG]
MGTTKAHRDAATAAVRYFGSQMGLLRKRAGLTQPELARLIGYSEAMVAAVEQGRRIPQKDFIDRVDDALGADGLLTAGAEFLAHARYPARFQDFAHLEAEAVSLYSYETVLVPGLLQTEDYARALMSIHCPPPDDETIEQRVAARMDRQALLTRRPGTIVGFVIEEAALRRRVGGTEVMRGQLESLLARTELRNVSIQVMPLKSGAHAGLNGPVLLMETSDRRTVAYFESQGMSTFVWDREDVSVHSQRYGVVRAQALNVEDSARLIKRMAEEL